MMCHLSVRLSLGLSVCLSGVLWKNGRFDLDAVWDGGSAESKDEQVVEVGEHPKAMGNFGWMWGITSKFNQLFFL